MNGPAATSVSGENAFTRLRVNSRGAASLDALRERLRGREVILLDYPVYYNVGDLLIFLGLLQMFEDEGVKVRLAQTHHSHSIRKIRSALGPDTVILFHGGGNFGDLYPKLHGDRLEVFTAFCDRELIVLPQTIHFRDEAACEETHRIARACTNLTILVRDEESRAIAESFGARVGVCPDTAHYLKVPANTRRDGSTLLFRRRDFETQVDEEGFDWDEIIAPRDKLVLQACKVLAKAAGATPTQALDDLLLSAWTAQCRHIFDKAVAKFSGFAQIDMDRLHAVILACLMEMPMVYGDTRFGKISRYREAWLEDA